MANDLVITAEQPISAQLASLVQDTIAFAGASRAEGTTSQYASCWKAFVAFCNEHALEALPADPRTVVLFLTSLAKAGKALSTVQGHLSAVKYFHERNNHAMDTAAPIISEVMAGIRRTIGAAADKSAAILPEDLRKLVAACEDGKAGLRDRAILLLGFAGAFRRSELTALTVEDIEQADQGIIITLRRSKTDQDGEGAKIAIPFGSDPALCPVAALNTWLSVAGIKTGPLFRRVRKNGLVGSEALSDVSIYRIVVSLVEAAGLDGKITPHSLRAGFCTAAALAGAGLESIARHARHSAVQTTMGYVRVAEQFKNHAGMGLL